MDVKRLNKLLLLSKKQSEEHTASIEALKAEKASLVSLLKKVNVFL